MVVGATQVGIWDHDMRTNRIYNSPQLKRLLGFADDEFNKADDWDERVHPEDYAKVTKTVEEAVGDRRPFCTEYRFRKKSGEYIWLKDFALAVYDNTGKPVRMVGAISDITESKRTEEALRAALDRFELAVEATRKGYGRWTGGREEFYRSPQFKRLFGFGPDELNGHDDWKALVDPEDLKRLEEASQEHLKTHKPYSVDLRIRTKSGELRWLHGHGQAEWDETGKAFRAAGALSQTGRNAHKRNRPCVIRRSGTGHWWRMRRTWCSPSRRRGC